MNEDLFERAWKLLVDLGYIHVHTWQESHGEYASHYFQAPLDWPLAVFSIDRYRNGLVKLHGEREPRNYLLAREIRANLKEEHPHWIPVGRRSISACCTAGHEDFRNRYSQSHIRITSVVGHGEWAFPIKKEEL